MKLHHKLLIHGFGSFAVVKLIILFVGLFAGGHFFLGVNAANESSWNNDNFIDERFWESNPTDTDIIQAIYGTDGDYDTAYTKFWDNYDGETCQGMTVIETGIIPLSFEENTIYLLSGSSFMIEDPIELKKCSSIISKDGTQIFTKISFVGSGLVSISGNYEYLGYGLQDLTGMTYVFSGDPMVEMQQVNFVVVDNLTLNGTLGYNNSVHEKNLAGIGLYGSENNTLHDVELSGFNIGLSLLNSSKNLLNNISVHNCSNKGLNVSVVSNDNIFDFIDSYDNYYGVSFYLTSGNTLKNSYIYNNSSYGLSINQNTNFFVNNLQSFNNSDNGIYLRISKNTAINNAQVYNNGNSMGDGISVICSNSNMLNNIQAYNNKNGIRFYCGTNSVDNSILKDVYVYNNDGTGIFVDIRRGKNYYYGKLISFSNGNPDNFTKNLLEGSLDSKGFVPGFYFTGLSLSSTYMTNPKNVLGETLYGDNLDVSKKKKQQSFAGKVIQYNYGYDVIGQRQPFRWEGDEIIEYDVYTNGKYVGSNEEKNDDNESFVVQFNTLQGSKVDSQIIKAGSGVLKPNDPTKTGSLFSGWFLDKNCTILWNFDTDVVTGDFVLYAKWNYMEYNISYEGIMDAVNRNKTKYSVKDGSFAFVDLIKTGFKFEGWYDTPTFENKITNMPLWNTGDMTLYAKWKEIPVYTIEFETDGGTEIESYTITGNEHILEPEEPRKTGYEFSGWYLSGMKTKWNFETDVVSGDMTLYAKWIEIPVYTVVFETDGGTEIESQTITGNEHILEPEEPRKTGYEFSGWYLSGMEIKWNFETDVVSGDMTLYAKWEEISVYTVEADGPLCEVRYNVIDKTSGSVVASLTGCNKPIIGTSLFHTFTGNGVYVFSFQDLVGNTGTARAEVTWIDNVAPVCNLEYVQTGGISGDVIAMLTGCSEEITGVNIAHTFTGNGVYVFSFQDLVGNTGTARAEVTGIDKNDHASANIGNVSLKFCNDDAESKSLSLFLEGGKESEICMDFTNNSDTNLTIKYGFVDGTITQGDNPKKACMDEGVKEKFGQYVTQDTGIITILARETVRQKAKVKYPSGFSGVVNGCLTYYVADAQQLLRVGKFIDIYSDKFGVTKKIFELDNLKFDKNYSDEMNAAYQYAYTYGITTMPTIGQADMGGRLTRIAMAKMLSNYAISILGQTPDYSKRIYFDDVTQFMDSEYDDGVSKAYQLGIMGINMPNNKFRPYDYVSRAEFATALSRLLYNLDDGKDVYYSTHMSLLKQMGIITNTNPDLQERRGYVMIMLMRSDIGNIFSSQSAELNIYDKIKNIGSLLSEDSGFKYDQFKSKISGFNLLSGLDISGFNISGLDTSGLNLSGLMCLISNISGNSIKVLDKDNKNNSSMLSIFSNIFGK